MGEIINNDLKGWAYASKSKAAQVASLLDICFYIKKNIKIQLENFKLLKKYMLNN